jgi:hypothetical protein
MNASILAQCVTFVTDEGHTHIGDMIDEKHLNTLAAWLCEHNCQHSSKILPNGEYCRGCHQQAGFLIARCPYIDMTRPAEPAS